MKMKLVSRSAYLKMKDRETRHKAWLKQHPGNKPAFPSYDFIWCDGELIACWISSKNPRTIDKFRRSHKEVIVPSQRDWSKKPVCEEVPMRFNATDKKIKAGHHLEPMTDLEAELFKVIDEIDTNDDLAKENFKLFRNLAMKAIHKFKDKHLVSSDGYTINKIVPDRPAGVIQSMPGAYKPVQVEGGLVFSGDANFTKALAKLVQKHMESISDPDKKTSPIEFKIGGTTFKLFAKYCTKPSVATAFFGTSNLEMHLEALPGVNVEINPGQD